MHDTYTCNDGSTTVPLYQSHDLALVIGAALALPLRPLGFDVSFVRLDNLASSTEEAFDKTFRKIVPPKSVKTTKD